MTNFANAAAFDDPRSALQAMGTNLSENSAIVDAHGRVLAYARTGGIIEKTRLELNPNETIYRFGSSAKSTTEVARGGWWIQKREFEKLLQFANSHGLFVGLAMRLLCLVPPEWSDAGLLVRARVVQSLLAWRGLANSVITPIASGSGVFRMPHQNDISARRIHQIFIPGLGDARFSEPPISVENVYHLDPNQSTQGFLYL